MSGFLAAVFVYGGWDGSMYVNEEVKHRRINPGRAAILAVAFLAVFYTLAQVGLQGVVSPKALANNSASAPVYVAGVLGGSSGAKAMALAIALSVIATVGTGIVLTARIIYGMASYRVLPEFLSNVSRRYATPVWSSIVVGFLLIAIAAVYLLTSSVQNAFDNVIAVTGLLFSIFYILTALAMIVYYRRRVFSSVWNTIVLGHPAARRGRVPGLGAGQVDHRRAGFAAVVAGRHHRARRAADAVRPVHPEVAVLPDQPGERQRSGGGQARLTGRPAASDAAPAQRGPGGPPSRSTAAGSPAGSRTARTAGSSARSTAA